MELAKIERWRGLASKAGAVFCAMALVTLLDGLLVHFREPANMVKVLPGESVQVNGELTDEARRVEELTFISDTDQLQVSFEAIHKGYFLGGDMWRGRLLVSPQIAPGEYHLAVLPRESSSPRRAPSFRILVFPDAFSLQKTSTSLIRRYLGISPFAVAAGCLPGILLAFGLVYYLAGRREALLAQEGKAEVYRVLRREGGYEIRFALGTVHGMGAGVRVRVFDEQGQSVGLAQVEESNETDSLAVITADQEIRTGFLVAR